MRGDLIEVFKIINGFEDVNYKDYFVTSNTGLRGHEFKVFKGRFNTTIRKNTFSQRVIDHWNNLSYDVVACTSVLQFKEGWIFSWKIEGLYKCLHFLPSEAVCHFFQTASRRITLNHLSLLINFHHSGVLQLPAISLKSSMTVWTCLTSVYHTCMFQA